MLLVNIGLETLASYNTLNLPSRHSATVKPRSDDPKYRIYVISELGSVVPMSFK